MFKEDIFYNLLFFYAFRHPKRYDNSFIHQYLEMIFYLIKSACMITDGLSTNAPVPK